jgi:hypothetical protein
MSDLQIVYYRYRFPCGWLTKGNPFGFEVYQPPLDGFPEPDPNPIEELYYVYGKWILRSRGKGRRQEFNVISQDHAKLWVEKYGDSNCVNSCKDAAFEKAVLETFKTENRAIFSDHLDQKQQGFFYPRDWNVLFVSKNEINTHLATKSFLFEHSDNLGLCAYVSPFLKIDRRYTVKKIIASKSVFEITRLDTANMDEFLKSRRIKLPFPLKDRVRKTELSGPKGFNEVLVLEDRLRRLAKSEEETEMGSRNSTFMDKGFEQKPKRGRRSKADLRSRTNRELLIAILLKHHRYDSKHGLNLDPISTEKARKQLGKSEATLSKTWKEIQPALTYANYVKLCGHYKSLEKLLKAIDSKEGYLERSNKDGAIDNSED